MTAMEVIESLAEMSAWSDRVRAGGKSICLVPTMGFFHEGHLALMRQAREIGDKVVVSLFVNPMQFGANEDLGRYPRAFARDCELAAQAGVSVMFAPSPDAVYPKGFQTRVEVEGLTKNLCGRSRPGHFAGVTTVVAKLFHMVKPHSAVFGEKDFQQLAVIKRMTMDLNLEVKIVSHPIVREKDGLAMSSRNSYLNAEERRRALSLHQALQLANQRVAAGERNAALLCAGLQQYLAGCGGIEIDYVAIVDPETLVPCDEITDQSLLALAVKIGRTRLIDNTRLLVS